MNHIMRKPVMGFMKTSRFWNDKKVEILFKEVFAQIQNAAQIKIGGFTNII